MALYYARPSNAPKVLVEREEKISKEIPQRSNIIYKYLSMEDAHLHTCGRPVLKGSWYTLIYTEPGVVYMRVFELPNSGDGFIEGTSTAMNWGIQFGRFGLLVDLTKSSGGSPHYARSIAQYLHSRRVVTKCTFEGCVFLLNSRDALLAKILMPILDSIFKQLHKPDTPIDIVLGDAENSEDMEDANTRGRFQAARLASRMSLAGLRVPILTPNRTQWTLPHDMNQEICKFMMIVTSALLVHMIFLCFPVYSVEWNKESKKITEKSKLNYSTAVKPDDNQGSLVV